MGLFADGAAVRRPGEETFRVINELVDGMITVSNDEVRTISSSDNLLFKSTDSPEAYIDHVVVCFFPLLVV